MCLILAITLRQIQIVQLATQARDVQRQKINHYKVHPNFIRTRNVQRAPTRSCRAASQSSIQSSTDSLTAPERDHRGGPLKLPILFVKKSEPSLCGCVVYEFDFIKFRSGGRTCTAMSRALCADDSAYNRSRLQIRLSCPQWLGRILWGLCGLSWGLTQ